MALIILLFLHLILAVHPQYLPQPLLSVSPAVITQNGSVMLHCGADDTLYQCHYYPKGRDTNTKPSSSCQLSLTGSELMLWTGRRSGSPEAVNIICFYSKKATAGAKPSDHSVPVAVVILDQKPIISVQYDNQLDEFVAVCEIRLSRSVTAEFSCQFYTGDLLFQKGESRKSDFEKLSCIFTASKNDLFSRLHLAKSREMSCDYSLNSDPSTRSPKSDKYDISVLLPVPTQPFTTQPSKTEDKATTALSTSSTTIFTKPPTTTPSISKTSSTTIFTTKPTTTTPPVSSTPLINNKPPTPHSPDTASGLTAASDSGPALEIEAQSTAVWGIVAPCIGTAGLLLIGLIIWFCTISNEEETVFTKVNYTLFTQEQISLNDEQHRDY